MRCWGKKKTKEHLDKGQGGPGGERRTLLGGNTKIGLKVESKKREETEKGNSTTSKKMVL